MSIGPGTDDTNEWVIRRTDPRASARVFRKEKLERHRRPFPMIVTEFGEHGAGDELRCGGMPGRTAIHAENMEWDELIPGVVDAFVSYVD